MMRLYAPIIRKATLRVTMTLRSEGHGGDPSPKLQGVATGISQFGPEQWGQRPEGF